MSHRVDLIDQGATVVLPSPERAASISMVEINGEQYVKLAVDVNRWSSTTRLVRLSDVVAFHDGPFDDVSSAECGWRCGKGAHSHLTEVDNHCSGFIAVHRDAPILLEVALATSAWDSLVSDEAVIGVCASVRSAGVPTGPGC